MSDGSLDAREARIARGLAKMIEEEAPKVAKRLTPARKRALLVTLAEGSLFAYAGRREVRKFLMDEGLVSSLPGPTWGTLTPLGRAVAVRLTAHPETLGGKTSADPEARRLTVPPRL